MIACAVRVKCCSNWLFRTRFGAFVQAFHKADISAPHGIGLELLAFNAFTGGHLAASRIVLVAFVSQNPIFQVLLEFGILAGDGSPRDVLSPGEEHLAEVVCDHHMATPHAPRALKSSAGRVVAWRSFEWLAHILQIRVGEVLPDAWCTVRLDYSVACLGDPTQPLGRLRVRGPLGEPINLTPPPAAHRRQGPQPEPAPRDGPEAALFDALDEAHEQEPRRDRRPQPQAPARGRSRMAHGPPHGLPHGPHGLPQGLGADLLEETESAAVAEVEALEAQELAMAGDILEDQLAILLDRSGVLRLMGEADNMEEEDGDHGEGAGFEGAGRDRQEGAPRTSRARTTGSYNKKPITNAATDGGCPRPADEAHTEGPVQEMQRRGPRRPHVSSSSSSSSCSGNNPKPDVSAEDHDLRVAGPALPPEPSSTPATPTPVGPRGYLGPGSSLHPAAKLHTQSVTQSHSVTVSLSHTVSHSVTHRQSTVYTAG